MLVSKVFEVWSNAKVTTFTLHCLHTRIPNSMHATHFIQLSTLDSLPSYTKKNHTILSILITQISNKKKITPQRESIQEAEPN
jgi:hypothetical protein